MYTSVQVLGYNFTLLSTLNVLLRLADEQGACSVDGGPLLARCTTASEGLSHNNGCIKPMDKCRHLFGRRHAPTEQGKLLYRDKAVFLGEQKRPYISHHLINSSSPAGLNTSLLYEALPSSLTLTHT